LRVVFTYCFVFLVVFLKYIPHATGSNVSDLWAKYSVEKDVNRRIQLLLQIAEWTAGGEKKDSILNLAITTAQYNSNDSLVLECYISYFQYQQLKDDTSYINNAEQPDSNALSYAENMRSIAERHGNNKWLFESYYNLASEKVDNQMPNKALGDANKAFYYVNLLDDKRLKIQSILLLGVCNEKLNLKIEAFKNYVNALYMANRDEHNDLIYKSYDRISSFYRQMNNYDKAEEYKKREIELMPRVFGNDSNRLMCLYNDLSDIFYSNDNEVQAQKLTNTVISYAKRNNATGIMRDALRIYRNFLFDRNKLGLIADFYTKSYPDELQRISKENIPLYYRLQACIQEVNGNKDSALLCYKIAERNLLQPDHNSSSFYMANFYRRFGQFLLRKGDLKMAEEKMLQSYTYAQNARYYPYLIEASSYLDSIYDVQQDYKAAYQYAKLNKAYADSQAMVTKSDELLRLEADNVEKEEQLMAERELVQTRRRHNIQYVSMIIIIATSFVILAMIGSFKVHKFAIQSIGFFCFILLFEFIILLADKQIEHATHGEPWKVLLIKIGLIAILSPSHHWMEHRVVQYLHEHKLIDASRLSLRRLLPKRKRAVKHLPKQPTKQEQEN